MGGQHGGAGLMRGRLGRVAAALRRQPVRAYLYGLLAPGAALAVAYGLTTQDKAALWIAFGGVALVVPGVEIARAKVTPMADPRTKDGRPAEILPEPADPPGGSWLR